MHFFLANLVKEQLKFLAKFYESREEFITIFYNVKLKSLCLKLFLPEFFSLNFYLFFSKFFWELILYIKPTTS